MQRDTRLCMRQIVCDKINHQGLRGIRVAQSSDWQKSELKVLPLLGSICRIVGWLRLTRARAHVKFFVFSPLSITFLEIWHFSVDWKRDKQSDRCVIDGKTSITSITNPSLAEFKWSARNQSCSSGTRCPRQGQWVPKQWDQAKVSL